MSCRVDGVRCGSDALARDAFVKIQASGLKTLGILALEPLLLRTLYATLRCTSALTVSVVVLRRRSQHTTTAGLRIRVRQQPKSKTLSQLR